MLTIRDLSGNEEHLTDFKELTLNRKVNGEKQLSLTLLPTPHNEHSFPMVEEESVLTFDNEEYVIKKMTERGIGNTTIKRVEAIHKFYVDMINKQQPNIHNGSLTFANFLSFVFSGTGYTFSSITDYFNAQSFENFGNDNRLALLQKGLERYKAEMEIVGKDVRFKRQVGNDTDFQFRYGHNIKSVEKNVDTTNLATIIRGTGKDGITAYYPSPNVDIFGEIDAPPVNDERFTTEESLLTEMKARLQDTPDFSITIDFVDLRAAGYPWTVPNEGDRVYVIYEPMKDLLIETRILEIKEVYNAKFEVIKTEVTLANHKKSFAGTMFDNVDKRLKDIVNDDGVIKYSVLDEAVRIATEALQSAQTELEFTNGIIARSKTDPNHLVLFNSAGIGVSIDGGQTFRTAMTGEGMVADLIVVGTMLADRIKGGTLTLGGQDNGNGRLTVLNESGELIADLDAERGGFEELQIGNVVSESVVKVNKSNLEFYVDPINGNDNNEGNSWANAVETIQRAIDLIPRFNEGAVTIWIHYENGRNIYEDIVIDGYTGNGSIVIKFQTTANKLNGSIRVRGCTNYVEISDATINSRSRTIIDVDRSTWVYFYNCKLYGNNTSGYGFQARSGSNARLNNCLFYDIVWDAIRSEFTSLVHVENCNGLVGTSGLVAVDSGVIRGHGSAPSGNTANIYEARGGDVVSDFTFPSAPTPPEPPPPPETTNSWSQTDSASYHDTARVWDSYTGKDVLQGKWNTAGPYRGCWFFGTGPSNAVTGKTIKRIRVYISRTNNSGYSSTVTAVIRPHGYTTKPAGQPSYLGASHNVGFKWGEGKWVTLPSSFHSLFQNGSAKGIMIYTTNTSNTNYMRFNPSARIEITYA